MDILKYYLACLFMFLLSCFFFYFTLNLGGKDTEFSMDNGITYIGSVDKIVCQTGSRGGADILIIDWYRENEKKPRSIDIQVRAGCMELPLTNLRGGDLSITIQENNILAFSVNGDIYLDGEIGVKWAEESNSIATSFMYALGFVCLFGALLCLVQLNRYKKLKGGMGTE